MKKTLILLAGYPGTGKSYLAGILKNNFPELTMLAPDTLKEKYWDLYGFDNEEQKEELIRKSWEEYYASMEIAFQKEKCLLSEYPFSEKQKDRIAKLCETYGYQVYTIRLVGDLDILFGRQKARDKNGTRHPGHVFSSYRKGKKYDNTKADRLLSYDEFIKRCTTRGYGQFSLGTTREVNVSDFSKVDYSGIIRELKML